MSFRSSSTRRIGVLDLGSNSVKMLVGESSPAGSPLILLEKSVGTRLGEGIHRHACLTERSMERTLDAVHEFVRHSDEFQGVSWRAVATSAVRDSENHHYFQKRFYERFGFPLRILSGDEEAEMIFHGVISDTAMIRDLAKIMVMDSGGGSAEWIQGSTSGIHQRISLNLGCVRMTDRFLQGNPYTQISFDKMTAFYKEQLLPLKQQFSMKNGILIGTGGSICTAATLDMHSIPPHHHAIHGHKISLSRLQEILEKLRGMTQEERVSISGLPPKRSDIIVAGIALFVSSLKIFGGKEIVTSLRGLRYGVLLNALTQP